MWSLSEYRMRQGGRQGMISTGKAMCRAKGVPWPELLLKDHPRPVTGSSADPQATSQAPKSSLWVTSTCPLDLGEKSFGKEERKRKALTTSSKSHSGGTDFIGKGRWRSFLPWFLVTKIIVFQRFLQSWVSQIWRCRIIISS